MEVTKVKYDELRDICDSEVEEEIPNESYRMAINYLQKYSAQEAGNAPRSSHSRPMPRTTCSPKRRKVRGNSFDFEGDNGKSDSFVEYASDVNDNQRTLRSDINLLGDNMAKIQLRQGYCYQFQKTGACTKVNCKCMHVNSNLSYPNRSHVTDHLSKPKPNRQWKPRHAQSSRVKKGVCFNFMNNKFCKYGDNCKFLHSNVSITRPSNNPFNDIYPNNGFKQHSNLDQEQHSFLGEIRELMDSVKAMVELQRKCTPPMAYTSCPSQQGALYVNQALPMVPLITQQ